MSGTLNFCEYPTYLLSSRRMAGRCGNLRAYGARVWVEALRVRTTTRPSPLHAPFAAPHALRRSWPKFQCRQRTFYSPSSCHCECRVGEQLNLYCVCFGSRACRGAPPTLSAVRREPPVNVLSCRRFGHGGHEAETPGPVWTPKSKRTWS